MAEDEAEVGIPDFLTGIVEVLRIEGASSYMNQNIKKRKNKKLRIMKPHMDFN